VSESRLCLSTCFRFFVIQLGTAFCYQKYNFLNDSNTYRTPFTSTAHTL
jgi:hypothetical protein